MIADDDDGSHRRLIRDDTRRLLKEIPDADYIIMGHHHLTMDETIEGGKCRLIVLGEWISQFSYAVFDGADLRLLHENSRPFI